MEAAQIQNLLTLAAFALLSVAALGGAVVAAGELRVRAQRRARLIPRPDKGLAPAAPASGGSLMDTITQGVRRLGQQQAVRDPSKVSDVRSRLMRAGFFNRDAPIIFLGAKAVAMLFATVAVLFVVPQAMKEGGMLPVAFAALISLIAIMGPDQVLKSRQRARETEYVDGFPDLLDLLVASVEAGLSLEAAVSRVTDELARRYPWMTVHLRLLTLELRAGKSRKEAWTAFADRLGIPDARAFATMLRQAEEMGTSLGETLTVFSNDMRAKRMLRAEEKALALPVKLTLPLILFIFPCLLGVLMLPAVYRLMQTFANPPGS